MEQIQNKIPQFILHKLKKANINSFEEFLTKHKNQICSLTKLSEKDVEFVTNVITETVLPNPFIRVPVMTSSQYLKTGCSNIDDLIKGIPVHGGITEIFGESGCGKTQLALQLSLQVQKSEIDGGLSGGCIYICTEDSFPSKRLNELQRYMEKLSLDNGKECNFSDHIYIEHIADVEQLKYNLSKRVPILLLREKIKIIIIDSIAGVFRYDNETNKFISRSEDLLYIYEKLCNFSNNYKLAVVCINQVTCDPLEGLKPCLGLAWSNLVQNRFQLTFSGRAIKGNSQIIRIRELKVMFSPYLPVLSTNFVISIKGVENCF